MATITAAGSAAQPINLPAMLKEAALTAFVILLLCAGVVMFLVKDTPGSAELGYRFMDVVLICIIGFLGRIELILLREGRAGLVVSTLGPFSLILLFILLANPILSLFGDVTDGEGITAALPFNSVVVSWIIWAVATVIAIQAFNRMRVAAAGVVAEKDEDDDRFGVYAQQVARYLGPILLIFAVILPFMPFADRRLLDIGVLVITYIMLGWGLNILIGLAGLLDLGYVAFYAVGAYSFALFAIHLDASFWISLPFAGLMAGSFGVMLGFPVLRLRGDYLAIVTLGFGEMVRIILLNWYTLTKGPDGLSGIPRPSFFGLPFIRRPPEGVETFHTYFGLEYASVDRVIFLYYLILIMALATNLFTIRIRKLPIGRAWEALREDEIACRSLGINPTNTKLTAFGIGAMFGGFAGSFFATRQGFISPESFVFLESAVIVAIVVLGGMGTQIGVVFAAFILIGLPEFFRDLQQYRMLAFGAAMVMIMLWRPRGLFAHREPTIRMFGRDSPDAESGGGAGP